jgi:hypothetical protein
VGATALLCDVVVAARGAVFADTTSTWASALATAADDLAAADREPRQVLP